MRPDIRNDYIYNMDKIAFILLFSLFSGKIYSQNMDTIIQYGSMKLVCYDKFDKRPEPSFEVNRFIMKKLRYPDEAREGSIQGTVNIRFTIDETGKVTKPTIISSPHKSLSDEAIRLLGLMPSWTPATIDGKPVSVSLTMPLIFKFE